MIDPTSDFQCVTITRNDGVATVRFDRQDKLNALSADLMTEITQAAEVLERDTSVHAIVLTGNDHTFSAGADLADPKLAARRTASLLEQREQVKLGPDMCKAWERLEQMTIVAIENFCIGGGVALALACDFRIAGKSAHLRLPEVPLGMNMSWHSLPRLATLVGPARAKQFTILGEKLYAEEAFSWGMVEQVVDDGSALDAALQMAERIAALPPIPVRMSKQAINEASNALHHATTFMDRDQFLLMAQSEDQKEAVSAFLEKREPKFSGN